MTKSGECLSYIQLTYPVKVKDLKADDIQIKWNDKCLDIAKIKKLNKNTFKIDLNQTTQDLYTFMFNLETMSNVFRPLKFEIIQVAEVMRELGWKIKSNKISFEITIEELEISKVFKPYQFIDTNGGMLSYRLYDSKCGGKKPLIIFLHGSGERGEGNSLPLLCNNVPTTFFEYARDVEDAIILLPQAPWNSMVGGWCFDQNAFNLKELISFISKGYPVDKNRIYLSGISNGASGVWNLLREQPEMYAAAISISGYLYPKREKEKTFINGASYVAVTPSHVEMLKQIPIWIFHAEDDQVVSVKNSQSFLNSLYLIGNKEVYYTEYKRGVISPNPHASWELAFNEKELLPWLFSKRKHIHRQ